MPHLQNKNTTPQRTCACATGFTAEVASSCVTVRDRIGDLHLEEVQRENKEGGDLWRAARAGKRYSLPTEGATPLLTLVKFCFFTVKLYIIF